MAKRVLSLDEHQIIKEALADPTMQAQIIDLQQKQLYEQGIQSDGSPTGDYAPRTIAYKLAYGDAYGVPGRIDHITGLDTGETYKSMRIDNEDKAFKVLADDRNHFFDREHEGLGLTGESINEIIPEIREVIIERVIEKING